MGLGQIQFGGLASGLDTNSIIQALLSVEAQPLQQLESNKAEAQGKINLLGTFEGLLETLQEKAEGLSTSDGFLASSVTLGLEGLVEATVTGTPQSGNHTIEVLQQAGADRYAFDGVTDPTAALSAGQISFDYDGTTYSVDVDGESLEEVAALINAEAEGAVSATVINTGASDAPNYQLVLAGDDSGEAFQIENLTSTVAEVVNPTELVNAQNAIIELDQLQIERSTNSFDDVISGVSIEILDSEPGTVFSLNVGTDTEGVKTQISEFVDAYNAVVDFVNKQNEFTANDSGDGGETGGPLFGETILQTVQSSMSQAMFDVDLDDVLNDTAGFSTLSVVGISFDTDGRLSIDDETLDAKIAEDVDALMDLFVDTDGESGEDDTTGIMASLVTNLENLLESSESLLGDPIPGLIDARQESLQADIDLYDKRIEDLERRLDDLEVTLVQRFAALEELMAGLNAQGSFLSQSAGQLPGAAN